MTKVKRILFKKHNNDDGDDDDDDDDDDDEDEFTVETALSPLISWCVTAVTMSFVVSLQHHNHHHHLHHNHHQHHHIHHHRHQINDHDQTR